MKITLEIDEIRRAIGEYCVRRGLAVPGTQAMIQLYSRPNEMGRGVMITAEVTLPELAPKPLPIEGPPPKSALDRLTDDLDPLG